MWPEDTFNQWWDGDGWQDMPSLEMEDKLYAHGWEKKRLSDAKQPTIEKEAGVLKQSRRQVIKSTAAIDKSNKKKSGFGLIQ